MKRRQFLKSGLLFVPTIFVPRLIRAQANSLRDSSFVGLVATPAAASFAYTAATFDGTNDYMNRGASFTGIADSKTGIFSCWYNFNVASDGTFVPLLYGDGTHRIYRRSDNFFGIEFFDGAAFSVNLRNNNAITSASGWVHVVSAWDSSDINKTKMYINGSDDTVAAAQANQNIGYSGVGDWGIPATSGGAIPGALCLSEMYFAAGQWLDLTNSANVQKFRSAGAKPVNLGSDGSTPTGSQPTLYFHIYDGTNAGSGGNLTTHSAPFASCTAP